MLEAYRVVQAAAMASGARVVLDDGHMVSCRHLSGPRAVAMNYMFLLYNSEAARDAAPAADVEHCLQQHRAVLAETDQRGILRGASPLQPTSTAKTVRMHGAQPLIIDGPFAETKEQLGGYYIIDCKDLDEAIAWAKKLPTVGGTGCIEIRALMELQSR
jgi:hypothetical protein